MTPSRNDGRGRPTPPSALSRFAGRLRGLIGRAVVGAARRPGISLAAVTLIAGGGLFGWNALTQQAGRHPAPLFAGAKGQPPLPEPPRRPDLAAAPAPRPDTNLASMQTGTIPASAKPKGDLDAIGALIRSGGEPAARKAEPAVRKSEPAMRAAEPAKADAKAADAKVASAQKALSKLGYGPLKPDGVLGATTRNALLRFEREKNLPTTGAVAGRTAKQLATLSGLRVE